MIVKVHDCRIYHPCGGDHIVREYSEKESKWSNLEGKLEIAQIVAPEQVEPHLSVTRQEREFVRFCTKS